jgi:hypothetical protein
MATVTPHTFKSINSVAQDGKTRLERKNAAGGFKTDASDRVQTARTVKNLPNGYSNSRANDSSSPSSPSSPGRLGQRATSATSDMSNMPARSTDDVPHTELQRMYGQLISKYDAMKREQDHYDVRLRRQQETFIQKETDYQRNIRELRDQLHQHAAAAGQHHTSHMTEIRGLHTNVMGVVSEIQNKTVQVLKGTV